jgi:hypothetical protein
VTDYIGMKTKFLLTKLNKLQLALGTGRGQKKILCREFRNRNTGLALEVAFVAKDGP